MKRVLKTPLILVYIILLGFSICISCSTEESPEEMIPETVDPDPTDPDPDPADLTFGEVIAAGGDFEPFPESRTTEVVNESAEYPEDYETTDEDGEAIEERFICTSTTVSVLDGNGQFPLFSPSSDVIYPASLLQGETLDNATPSPIVVERAGGTISYDLNNGNTSSSFTVDQVTKSSIQDAMNNIINNAGDVLPANYQLEIVRIDSEEQMALEMGIDAQTFNAQVSADMSFSTNNTYNRTLVKLTQQYYTMSWDLPTSLEAIFAPSVTPEQLAVYVQADNPATFISSVTYGRIFYMLIETTSSRAEMDAKVTASYSAFNNSIAGELEVSTLSTLDNLRIKTIAYGGNTSGSFSLAGLTDASEIASLLEASTDIRAGLPLSYVVRSVERPDMIVGTTLATEYDVVECELQGVLPPGRYTDIVDLFDDGIGAMIHLGAFNLVLFNNAGTEYALFNPQTPQVLQDGSGNPVIFNINDPNAPLGNLQLADVGASVQVSVSEVELFDKSGFNMQRFTSLGDLFGETLQGIPTSPIGESGPLLSVNQEFSGQGYQFGSEGIQAGVRTGAVNYTYFRKPGDQFQSRSGQNFGSVIDTEAWFDGNSTNTPMFNRVNAASRFGSFSDIRYIFINDNGTELLEWNSFDQTFKGPWVIN